MTNQRFQVGRIWARRVIWGVIATFLMINAAAATTTYTYDALGRVIMVVYDNGSTVTYSYDAAGNRTTVATTGPT